MGWAIALHGGAGDIPLSLPPERRKPREEALRHCLQIGVKALKAKRPPLDVVELVVRELENVPCFNAGRGSVLTTKGTVEMEAAIMDGNTMNCGAVSGLTTVVNAISLARLVMEKTPHIYLAFDGAEEFAREQGVETVDSSHFITTENIERLQQAKESNRVQIDYTQPIQNDAKKETPIANGDSQIGTVGCVAVDNHGNLASATSTGGLVNKMAGRIGDTPLIGAGTYANELCAVSATGKGEAIIRCTAARDVAALMEFKGLSLKDAAACVVEERTPKGTCGLVAVSATGEIAMPYNTTGMFRACATEDGYSEVYEGAVYMCQGKTYLFGKLDLSNRISLCKEADLKYYMKTRDYTDIHVVGVNIAYPGQVPTIIFPKTNAGAHICKVTTTWFGFYRIRRGSNQIFDTVDLALLPEYSYESQVDMSNVRYVVLFN